MNGKLEKNDQRDAPEREGVTKYLNTIGVEDWHEIVHDKASGEIL